MSSTNSQRPRTWRSTVRTATLVGCMSWGTAVALPARGQEPGGNQGRADLAHQLDQLRKEVLREVERLTHQQPEAERRGQVERHEAERREDERREDERREFERRDLERQHQREAARHAEEMQHRPHPEPSPGREPHHGPGGEPHHGPAPGPHSPGDRAPGGPRAAEHPLMPGGQVWKMLLEKEMQNLRSVAKAELTVAKMELENQRLSQQVKELQMHAEELQQQLREQDEVRAALERTSRELEETRHELERMGEGAGEREDEAAHVREMAEDRARELEQVRNENRELHQQLEQLRNHQQRKQGPRKEKRKTN